MRNYYLIIFMLFTCFAMQAQVGIGTMDPDQSAELDVSSTDKGILIPRIPLTSVSSSSPITTPAESLVIYNTTVGTGLVKGFYYWTGSTWSLLATTENVAALESQSTIVDNHDGTFTYVQEDGTPTNLDIKGNIDEYETKTTLTFDSVNNVLVYTDEDLVEQTVDMAAIAKLTETLTHFDLNPDLRTLEYKDEEGNLSTVDLAPVIKQWEDLTILSFDPLTSILTYTDEEGTIHNLTLQDGLWSTSGNTGLVSPVFGTKDAKDISIITDGTERLQITKDGRFLWDWFEPTTTTSFAVNGSQAATIETKTADYTASANDYVIVFEHSGATTFTLPSATENQGRIYIVLNYGATDLTISPAITTGYNQTTTTLTNGVGKEGGIAFGNRVWLQSDGSKWLVIDN